LSSDRPKTSQQMLFRIQKRPFDSKERLFHKCKSLFRNALG